MSQGFERSDILKMISLNKVVKLCLSTYLIFLQLSVSLAEGDGRIVGGYSTTINEAPYLVQIKDDDAMLCGGTLITRRHVLTAAHCFIYNPQNLVVVGGATKVTDADAPRSNVTGYIIHPAFNEEEYNMDIAVIRLRTPLRGREIKPIKLLCETNWKMGDTVKLFGWGQLEEDSFKVPTDLQTVEVNVFDKEECTDIYRFQRKITESMECAAAPSKDSCSGDSGGPAIINNQLCGVISWGTGCGQENVPGVYTNINVVMGFIKAAVKKLQ